MKTTVCLFLKHLNINRLSILFFQEKSAHQYFRVQKWNDRNHWSRSMILIDIREQYKKDDLVLIFDTARTREEICYFAIVVYWLNHDRNPVFHKTGSPSRISVLRPGFPRHIWSPPFPLQNFSVCLMFCCLCSI
jgi:hypothetical protein